MTLKHKGPEILALNVFLCGSCGQLSTSSVFVTDRVHSTAEGYVFTGMCLFRWREGRERERYPRPGQGKLPSLPQLGQGTPHSLPLLLPSPPLSIIPLPSASKGVCPPLPFPSDDRGTPPLSQPRQRYPSLSLSLARTGYPFLASPPLPWTGTALPPYQARCGAVWCGQYTSCINAGGLSCQVMFSQVSVFLSVHRGRGYPTCWSQIPFWGGEGRAPQPVVPGHLLGEGSGYSSQLLGQGYPPPPRARTRVPDALLHHGRHASCDFLQEDFLVSISYTL